MFGNHAVDVPGVAHVLAGDEAIDRLVPEFPENRDERAIRAGGDECNMEVAVEFEPGCAGIGSTLELSLGGKSGVPGDAPLRAQFRVDALSDGRLLCKGPFYRGAKMELGLSACLSIDGVRIVLASKKTQLADQELYRFVGIEPTAQAILVNKSSVHFRADFAPIAEQILVAKAPGPMIADPSEFPWKRLARGIRLKPNGKAF